MRRMFSEKQIKEMISAGAQGEIAEALEGDISIGGDLDVAGSINGEEHPSVKPIYWHTVKFQRGGTAETATASRLIGYMIILNNDPTPLTIDAWKELLGTQGFVGVLHGGKAANAGAANLEDMDEAIRVENYSANQINVFIRDTTTNVETAVGMTINSGWVSFNDLGVNQIN